MKNETQTIIQKLIDKHNLSTEYLAVKLYVSEATIRNYRDGVSEPKQPTLEKLKQILNGYESKIHPLKTAKPSVRKTGRTSK